MHLFLWAEDAAGDLEAELAQGFPGIRPSPLPPAFLQADFAIPPDSRRLPFLAFARQWLPDARPLRGVSIRDLATALTREVIASLPDNQPWALHVEARYAARAARRIGARAWHSATRHGGPRGARPEAESPTAAAAEMGGGAVATSPEAGRRRAALVRATALDQLRRERRHLFRQLRGVPGPFTPADALVQFILTTPEAGFLSVARAPLPFEQRHLLSPFPGGEIAPATDREAPSRAFAKLVEAEQRFGRAIGAGETCADLGAAPGSWTYVAVQRGARVTAVDRSPLRADLLSNPRVLFQPGDAFRFQPARPVDWLLCDVIAAPERTAALLLEWLRRAWCRRFIVTLKTGDAPALESLARLKQELPALTDELFLTRLCANKKEICVFGSARRRADGNG